MSGRGYISLWLVSADKLVHFWLLPNLFLYLIVRAIKKWVSQIQSPQSCLSPRLSFLLSGQLLRTDGWAGTINSGDVAAKHFGLRWSTATRLRATTSGGSYFARQVLYGRSECLTIYSLLHNLRHYSHSIYNSTQALRNKVLQGLAAGLPTHCCMVFPGIHHSIINIQA